MKGTLSKQLHFPLCWNEKNTAGVKEGREKPLGDHIRMSIID